MQSNTEIPRYVVNLDDPPAIRWKHVVKDYKDKIPLIMTVIRDMLGNLSRVIEPLISLAFKTKMLLYREELKGIAKEMDISPSKLLLIQLAYEAFAACTSLVVNGEEYPIHIRTMDWEMPELKELTIEVDFMYKNQPVFTGVTWAGYIGILTGMKPNGFSVAINYRRTEEGSNSPTKAFIRNIWRTIRLKWPVGYLVRETLSGQTSYASAVKIFQEAQLIAPTYISVCGIAPNEGVIISRNRSSKDNNNGNVTTQLVDGPLAQANMDHWRDDELKKGNRTFSDWQDISESRSRREFVIQALKEQKVPDEEFLCLMACTPPFRYDDTIYTSLMVPAKNSIKTWDLPSKNLIKKGKRVFKKANDVSNQYLYQSEAKRKE